MTEELALLPHPHRRMSKTSMMRHEEDQSSSAPTGEPELRWLCRFVPPAPRAWAVKSGVLDEFP